MVPFLVIVLRVLKDYAPQMGFAQGKQTIQAFGRLPISITNRTWSRTNQSSVTTSTVKKSIPTIAPRCALMKVPHDMPRTRAVSGHATEAMQHRYSTVAPEEMRESLGKVISLVKMKAAMAVLPENQSRGGVQGGVHGTEKKKAS
jgi:hypothetical protein